MVGVPGQEARRIRTSDGDLAFEEHGLAGRVPTVVCLHGLTANRSTWLRVAELASHACHLILVDLLARGQSDSPTGARFDLESEAGRLEEFVEQAGLCRPILAGHSHGAAVAVAASLRLGSPGLLLVNPVTPELRRPAILGALSLPWASVALAPALRLFRRPLTRYTLARRVFTGPSGVPEGAIERYAAPWSERDRARLLVEILAGWNPADLETWAGVALPPAVVVAGGRDRRVPPEVARQWSVRIGASFRELADCGHSAPEEDPAAVVGALRDLLRLANHARGESDTG